MTTLAAPSVASSDRYASAPVQVLTVEQFMTTEAWPAGTRLVVEATGVDAPSLPVLARVARIRREVRAAGGDLVLAANIATAALLRSSGLHKTVPHHDDVSTAVAYVDRLAGPDGAEAPQAKPVIG